jgi:hypothetical protein
MMGDFMLNGENAQWRSALNKGKTKCSGNRRAPHNVPEGSKLNGNGTAVLARLF